MKRSLLVVVALSLACGRRPVPSPATAGGQATPAPRPRTPRALTPGERIELSPEGTAELAWEVRPPASLPDERGRIMCFFKDEFETGTTLGWENVSVVGCPGRPGHCLLLAPAPDERSAVSARLQQEKIFAQSSDFLMTFLCAADAPVEVTVEAASDKAPGELFEKRIKLDTVNQWTRFDFPTSELRSGESSPPEGGMVSELMVRAGRPTQDVKFLLDDVRIYTRLPEPPPGPEPAPLVAKKAPPRPPPSGTLFLSDFEEGADGWAGRRVTRRGGGRALAGKQTQKEGVRSISVSKTFRFEAKPGLRLAFSCRFGGEGVLMIVLFGEGERHYFTLVEDLKDGVWTDHDISVDRGRFFSTAGAVRNGAVERKPLQKGTVVSVLAFVATGKNPRELVVDDVKLYATGKPAAPPAPLLPELVSGPDWFDLFNGHSLDGWQEPYPIKWAVKEKSLHASAPFQEGYLYTRETFADFEMQARLRPGSATPGEPEVRFKFRWDFDKAAGYEFRAGKKAILVKCGEGGDETLASATLGGGIEKGRPCVLRILARGERVECRVNGREVANVAVKGPSEGAIGLGVFHGEVFVDTVKLKEFD